MTKALILGCAEPGALLCQACPSSASVAKSQEERSKQSMDQEKGEDVCFAHFLYGLVTVTRSQRKACDPEKEKSLEVWNHQLVARDFLGAQGSAHHWGELLVFKAILWPPGAYPLYPSIQGQGIHMGSAEWFHRSLWCLGPISRHLHFSSLPALHMGSLLRCPLRKWFLG